MLVIEQVTDTRLTQLQPGDQLLRYNDFELPNERALNHAIGRIQAEQAATATLHLVRNNQKIEVDIPTGSLGLTFQQPNETAQTASSYSKSKQQNPPSISTGTPSPQNTHPVPPVTEHYRATRIICSFIRFFGWISVLLGLIVIAISFSNNISNISIMGILMASGPIVGGLLMVLLAQVAIAILDIADNSRATREMTALLLQKKEHDS